VGHFGGPDEPGIDDNLIKLAHNFVDIGCRNPDSAWWTLGNRDP